MVLKVIIFYIFCGAFLGLTIYLFDQEFKESVVKTMRDSEKYPLWKDIDDDDRLFAIFCIIIAVIWPYFLYVAVTSIIRHLKK